MPRLVFQRTLCLTVLLLILTFATNAQVYQFRNFSIEEGVPHRNIWTINQDPSGYLWLGTSTDIARFNGFEFESNPYGDSLPSDFVSRSFADSRGRIWFGHNNGSVSVLENKRISIVGNQGVRTMITGISEDSDGNILISSQQHGLLVVDPEMNTVLFDEDLTSLQITSMDLSGDDLLAGTFEGLYRFDYGNGKLSGNGKLIESVPRVAVSSILPVNTREVFVGTRGQGLFHLIKEPDGSYSARNIGLTYGLGSVNTESVYLDNQKNIWISTRGQGVFRINGYFESGQDPSVDWFSSKNGLPSDYVYGVFKDSEGNLWFTTNNGLSMLKDEAFSFHRSFDEPFGRNVLAVYSDNDYIWLGGESSLLRISKENQDDRTLYGTSRGVPFDMITALVSCDDNHLWIGTAESGIYRLDHEDQQAESFHVSANSLENTVNDLQYHDGILKAATNNGVIVFDLKAGERLRYSTNEGLPRNQIRSIYRDSEGIDWISVRSNRLVDIENRHEIRIAEGELEFIAVTEDYKGRLWIATNGNGIIKLRNDSIIHLTTDDGLHSNFCYSLLAGNDEYLWIGHRLGVSRVNTDSYHVRTYGTESAIRGDFNLQSSHITSDSVLLFGTTDGLVSFDPEKERTDDTAPILNITSLQISDEEHEVTRKVSLPYGSYKLRIEFIGLKYSDPSGVRYQYKMEGYDLDWSDVSEYRFAYYPRLDDGNFQFLLRAYGAEGIITETPLSLAIIIEKPIWKKWYFFVFIIFFAGLMVFLIIKIRERNLRHEKERIEKELAIRTREVIEQKVEIEHKNRDITDSINYAQRIQASILPPISRIEDNFNESFVFYKPRDIVSGDFYWFDKVTDKKFLIVCADSTGHGVPGAFMSMIGTTLIKDICMRQDVNSPSSVLETLDRDITSTLNQNIDPASKSSDGMDITVCEFDLETRYLRFASAMRPIMMLHKGELTYIRGSRNSIGGYYTETKKFENQGYQLDPGDIVYLFSDGYPDQFGGPLGKKYKMVRLKNLINDICNKPMKEQSEHVRNNFNLWKGDYEQVDDVLFMGIKV